jgi:Ni/Co efflux regulator RcnB
MMRTSILATIFIAGSMMAFQATAQQAAPSNQTRDQIHSDADKQLKTTEPNEQMQHEADKSVKTRNSGESGFVADQDKSGSSAHPPGQPGSDQTTGSSSDSRRSDPK